MEVTYNKHDIKMWRGKQLSCAMMKLTVEDRAAEWFQEEVGIGEGAGIRFKAKIYGSSPVNDTFALAIDSTKPIKPIAEFKAENGLLFFVEENDEWFFQGHDLIVSYDEESDEPKYIYSDGETLKS